MEQTTIARRVVCRGVGLHSGQQVEIAIEPADADSGIVFVLVGVDQAGVRSEVELPARPELVVDTSRATTLAVRDPGAGEVRVTTVEHLLASLFALGIDNARVEVRGPEIPVLDGAAAAFCARINEAGPCALPASRRLRRVVGTHEIRDGDRWIRVEPCDGLQIEYTIDFPHPMIGRQTFAVEALDPIFFERELAPARTFGFTDEVEALRRAGLAQGGGFDNTIVLDAERVLNPSGLRWPDEFVRHKILDLIGDLALLGAPLHARICVEKGGHGLHHRLVQDLIASPGLMASEADTRPAEASAAGESRKAGTPPRSAYSA